MVGIQLCPCVASWTEWCCPMVGGQGAHMVFGARRLSQQAAIGAVV